jgi:hypothetical protein
VYLAEVPKGDQTIRVAVKMLRTKAAVTDKEEFLAEAEMMLGLECEQLILVR